MKNEVLLHWQIQERLLQSTRALFLSSQTIIFALAAFIVISQSPGRTVLIVFLLLLILGGCLLYLGTILGRQRGFDVSYFQMVLLRIEQGVMPENVFAEFKQWQKFPASRTIMEIFLPLLYSLAWIVLAALALYHYF
jgi:hypothetical protein